MASATAANPSRLLELGGAAGNSHRLVECGSQKKLTYAAVSYCWGASKFIQSNRSTYTRYKRAIPPCAFPTAFRDAILVCQKFGLYYLWIDSLCILQDDLHEWAVESAKMADIYEGASLVIAATTAVNPHRSFLDSINSASDRMVEIEPEEPLYSLPAVKARRLLRKSGWHLRDEDIQKPGMLDANPLEARGWALQEKLLARRYISFAEKEMQWHCKSDSLCECETPPDINTLVSEFRSDLANAPFAAWHVAVMVYTARSMSHPEDKLAALAGIAARIAPLLGSSYFCGIWRAVLVEELCWRRAQHCGSWEPFEKGINVISRAPTFSWASIMLCLGLVGNPI